jgi:4-hydroxybenzoate polyprenyltransferase
MTPLNRLTEKILITLGFFICCVSLILIILGLWSFISLEQFAYGLSSGIRVLVSCAIIGCLMSAIGYGIGDYFNNESKE